MSGDSLRESLSALLDDEAQELELRRLLGAEQAELRATWSRYQVARAAMHGELREPRLDLAAAVSAALADEASPTPRRSLWQGVGRLAVAASVTLAVLAGVRLYNQDSLDSPQFAQQPAQPLLSTPQVHGPALLAGYSEGGLQQVQPGAAQRGGQPDWYLQRLPGYLRQHAQQAAFNVPESALPYARAASLENR